MKTIILDFDGTMGDTNSLIVRTMQQTIAKLGLPQRTDEQCAAMIGLPLRRTFTELIPMDEETGRKCEETYAALFDINNVPGAVPLFPHVKETLKEMHDRGMTLTIASSRGRDTLTAFVRDMGLEEYISYIVSAWDVTDAKPAPEMVNKILAAVGGTAEDALVVGDTVFDIEMGRSAGTKTCAVTYGNGKREDFVNADFVIDDFGELLNIV
ncbi:MAG: HAD-IA family hydrolase [Prevotella sp.]|nr:HAD-IA family hydrolase [Prevotella sp.]